MRYSTTGSRSEAGSKSWRVQIGNVTVRHLPFGERADTTTTTLCDAQPGETVRVVTISQTCQGSQRRRLLDLGFVRGAEITRELTSATGNPIAYRIHGALIALRLTQSAWITVERLSKRGTVEVN